MYKFDFSLRPHSTPDDYDFNKLKSTLLKDASTEPSN